MKQTYYGVLQALALIQGGGRHPDQKPKRLEQAKGFYQAGTRPKIDVTNAEVNLANVQLALIRAKNNYQVARVTLNNAMGLREDLNFAIDKVFGFKPREIALGEILTFGLCPASGNSCRSKPDSAVRRRRSNWPVPATTPSSPVMPATSGGRTELPHEF